MISTATQSGVVPAPSRAILIAVGAALLMFMALLYSLCSGAVVITPGQALGVLLSDDGSQLAFVVRELRLPRSLIAMLVGAGLSCAGLIIQSVTRNPLGDPGLMGVSAGASFAVALTYILLGSASVFMLPAGFGGGIVALGITLLLGRRSRFDPLHLVLAGMAVSIFFIAATSALMIVNRTSLQALYFWLVGGFINRTWFEWSLLWPFVPPALALTALFARYLDVLAFGDDIARSLGVKVLPLRLGFLLLACTMTAACVAAAGPIGFIGFAVPHLTRLLLGQATEHARLLPLVVLNGAALTLVLDSLSRSGLLGKQLPAGVYTALFGGALLLLFLKKRAGV